MKRFIPVISAILFSTISSAQATCLYGYYIKFEQDPATGIDPNSKITLDLIDQTAGTHQSRDVRGTFQQVIGGGVVGDSTIFNSGTDQGILKMTFKSIDSSNTQIYQVPLNLQKYCGKSEAEIFTFFSSNFSREQ